MTNDVVMPSGQFIFIINIAFKEDTLGAILGEEEGLTKGVIVGTDIDYIRLPAQIVI